MKRTLFATLSVISLISLFAGCSAPPVEDDASKLVMNADVAVTSDPGSGVGGVALVISEQAVATTDANGRAGVQLHGTEGDTVALGVRCPAGFESPAPLRIALRRLSKESRVPRFDARCTPLQRTVVVGIRADNGANLPIYRLGKRVGQTDGTGAAHLVLQVNPNEQITLTLDTKGHKPALRPESPTLTFVAKDRDDFVILDQRFDAERVVGAPSRPRPARPERI